MENEKYCFDVDEEGQQGLIALDRMFNETTQSFLLKSGLKPGLKVLELGCGIGTMSTWITAIDLRK